MTMPGRGKPIQTKLNQGKNDNAWKTIGRAKRHVQSTELLQELKETKKTDNKATPPRPIELPNVKQDPLQTPLPDSPKLLNEGNSDAELKLIAALNALNSSKKIVPLAETEFPPLSPPHTKSIAKGKNRLEKNKSSKDTIESDTIMTEVNNGVVEDTKPSSINKATKQMAVSNDTQTMDTEDNNSLKSFFVSSFPENFSSAWTKSSANNYEKPNTEDMDAVDLSLLSENEHRSALCLPPFSKEFFIATGQSKLQVSEEYQELIRVMVWHNRSRRKQGLTAFSPEELELFLKEEMSQDFDDLDIDIDDFLADLIKIRHAEHKSFDVYNKFITNN
jgi:hypothetical protein